MKYEKIYRKLKNMVEQDLKFAMEYDNILSDHNDIIEKTRNKGYVECLAFYLENCMPELEGKKWNNIFFNEQQYLEWKEELKNEV